MESLDVLAPFCFSDETREEEIFIHGQDYEQIESGPEERSRNEESRACESSSTSLRLIQ